MATFERALITTKGKEFISRIIANETQLIFTRLEASDYVYSDIVDIKNIQSIDNPKQTVNISNVSKEGTKVKIHAVFTNEGLANSYNMNVIGIYAKDSNNEEILFAVLTSKNGDVMTSRQGSAVTSITFDLIFNISDTQNVSITVNNNALATAGMLKDVKNNLEKYYVKNIDYATEQNNGIIKIYPKSNAETDSKKIKEYTRTGKGNNKDIVEPTTEEGWQEYEKKLQNAKTYWEKFIEEADHTKVVTVKDLAIILKDILQPAAQSEYGLVSYDTIREVAPQPNLSPYVRFDKGYRVKDSTTEFVRTNNHITWAGYVLEMYNGDNNQFMGKFHTNGGRAYYAVPNRNGGNWNEIMDNHDMAARDNRMNGMDSNITNAHNRITDTWNKAVDAWNKAHDAQVNRIYEIRLAGYIEEGINSKNERNGYVLTKVSRLYGQAQDSIRIGSRVLQFFRNGQWLNAYFA